MALSLTELHTRPLILRALDTTGASVRPQKVLDVHQDRDLYHLYVELGIEDRDALACMAFPHARSSSSDGFEFEDLSLTLAEIDSKCLQPGLARCSVIAFKVGPRQRTQQDHASTSRAAPSALTTLMARGQAAYTRNILLTRDVFCGFSLAA